MTRRKLLFSTGKTVKEMIKVNTNINVSVLHGWKGRHNLLQLLNESLKRNHGLVCNQFCFWNRCHSWKEVKFEGQMLSKMFSSFHSILMWNHLQKQPFSSTLLAFFRPASIYSVINSSHIAPTPLFLVPFVPLHSASNGISVWCNLLTEDVPGWPCLCFRFWWDYMWLCPLRDWTCSFWC